MRKRIVAALLTVVFTMVTGIMEPAGAGLPCAAAVAQDSEAVGDASITEGDFQFEEMGNGTLKLIKYKGSGERAEIPESVHGKAVVMIGDSAFYGCDALTGITIPAGVTNIGGEEYDVFRDCASLTEIIVDAGNAHYSSVDGVLCNQDKTELLVCPAGKTGRMVVADGIKTIETGAFNQCSKLESMTIPVSVTEIRIMLGKLMGSGFSNCRSLTEIVVNAGNSTYCSQEGMLYSKDTFSNTLTLQCCPPGKAGRVEVPENVSSISRYAFQNCRNLTEFAVEEGNTNYTSENGILYNTGELIRCPAKKKGIVEIPDGVRSISYGAFHNCEEITEITIGKDMVDFFGGMDDDGYGETLSGCNNLEMITVDAGNRAYTSWNGILYSKDMSRLLRCPPGKKGRVEIPDGVERIVINSFSDCIYLECVKISKSVSHIDDSEDYYRLGTTFYNCGNLSEITVDSQNKRYCSIDGMLFLANTDGAPSGLFCCPEGKSGSVTIPDGVIEINYDAFRNCKNLIHVGLPDSLRSIERRAFEGCSSLESLELPEGIDEIYYDVFRNCVQLSSIYIPESVETILEGAFEGCGKLSILCVEGSEAKSYAIKNGIPYQLTESRKRAQNIMASDFTKKVGDDPFFIQASTDGDGALSYASSDEAIVYMTQEGVAVIKNAGTATITVTASETERYKAAKKEITVTVNLASGSEVTPPSPGKKTYTITFHANGGKILSEASRKREEGAEIGTLPMAERSGYDLTGWFTLPAGGAAVTQNTKVTSDITVYAQWKKKEQPGTGGTAQKPGGSNDSDGNLNEADQIRIAKSVRAKIKSAKNVKTRSVKLKLSGLSDCDGYQIQYGLKKNFKGAKSMKKKGGSITLKKLKMKKTYYVRARTYKRIDGTLYYGKWSSKKSIKIKK